MPDMFEKIVQEYVHLVIDVTIGIGPCSFRLLSNVDDFVALKYFSLHSQKKYANDEVDYELYCISLKKCGLSKEKLAGFIDKSCRGDQFAKGYYVTDHFGDPVYLVSRGSSYFVFGEELERVVWPYFVKYFLLLYSIKKELLFLKSSAFSINSQATLLLGRGSSGKTVFLSAMCLNGANFISNSHAIIENQYVYGVASAMRIRPEPWCENLFNKNKVHPGIRLGEIIVDPYNVFRVNTNIKSIVKNICVLNFKEPNFHKIEKISHQEAYNYTEQFSLGINVYRLEEDLLDFHKNNIHLFSKNYNTMKKKLFELVQQSNCYYISSDVLNPRYRDEIFSLLAGS